jgi:hypothetical protein
MGPRAGPDVLEKRKMYCSYRESNSGPSSPLLYRLRHSGSTINNKIYVILSNTFVSTLSQITTYKTENTIIETFATEILLSRLYHLNFRTH